MENRNHYLAFELDYDTTPCFRIPSTRLFVHMVMVLLVCGKRDFLFQEEHRSVTLLTLY